MTTKRTLVFRIRKKHLEFLKHIIRKIGLENLTHTRYMEDKNKINQEKVASILPEELVIDCTM